jgi:hypothetical protein
MKITDITLDPILSGAYLEEKYITGREFNDNGIGWMQWRGNAFKIRKPQLDKINKEIVVMQCSKCGGAGTRKNQRFLSKTNDSDAFGGQSRSFAKTGVCIACGGSGYDKSSPDGSLTLAYGTFSEYYEEFKEGFSDEFPIMSNYLTRQKRPTDDKVRAARTPVVTMDTSPKTEYFRYVSDLMSPQIKVTIDAEGNPAIESGFDTSSTNKSLEKDSELAGMTAASKKGLLDLPREFTPSVSLTDVDTSLFKHGTKNKMSLGDFKKIYPTMWDYLSNGGGVRGVSDAFRKVSNNEGITLNQWKNVAASMIAKEKNEYAGKVKAANDAKEKGKEAHLRDIRNNSKDPKQAQAALMALVRRNSKDDGRTQRDSSPKRR